MRRRSSALPFLVLNVIISAVVVFIALQLFGNRDQGEGTPATSVPLLFAVSTTPDVPAEQTRVAQAAALTVTAVLRTVDTTPTVQTVQLPDELRQPTPTPNPDAAADPPGAQSVEGTADAPEADAAPDDAQAVAALPEGCVQHVLAEGEFPSTLAQQYGVAVEDILAANGLTESDAQFLQIGQTLIVPQEGCSLEQLAPSATPVPTEEAAAAADADDSTPLVRPTRGVIIVNAGGGATATPAGTLTATPSPSPTITPTPTITLAPTAASAQIEITIVRNVGDVTAEQVEIRNVGAVVDLTGWTLSDSDGNVYTFTEINLFTNAQLTLYTRRGDDVPIARFWGLDEAVWASGDVATLTDAQGRVQSTYRVP